MKFWFFILGLHALLHAEIVWKAEVQQPFELTIKLSTQQIVQGDLFDFEAILRYPSSYELNMDTLLDQLTQSANPLVPKMSLYQSKISSNSTPEGMQEQHVQATLSSLITGVIGVSFFTLTFLSKKEEEPPVQILTPVFNLHVLPLPLQLDSLPVAPLMTLETQFPLELTQANRQFLIDNPKRIEEEKRDIQRTIENHTFPWLTLMLLIGFGGIGWVGYLTRENWPKRQIKPMAVLSPKQQADHALQKLQENHFIEEGLFQTYYSELTFILLAALQARLGWQNRQLTTEEIAQTLRDEPAFSSAQKENILSFLSEIDEVKFAAKKPSSEAAKEMYHRIQNFIQQLFS